MSEDNTYDPSEHGVDEVKEYVEKNPDQAQAVLKAEQDGKNRKTLVSALEEQVNATPQPQGAPTVTVTPGTPDSGEVRESTILGQTYTVDPLKGYRVKAGQASKS